MQKIIIFCAFIALCFAFPTADDPKPKDSQSLPPKASIVEVDDEGDDLVPAAQYWGGGGWGGRGWGGGGWGGGGWGGGWGGGYGGGWGRGWGGGWGHHRHHHHWG